MIDLSGIEYDFLPGLLWWLVPGGVAVGYLWWMFATSRQDSNLWSGIGALAFLLGGTWLMSGGILMLGIAPTTHVDKIEKQLTETQLEELGYANIDMQYGRNFTASKDGQYFRGALVHDHDYVYQVVQLSVE